jgi:hypothetical protein
MSLDRVRGTLFPSEPIFQHKGGHANTVQEARRFLTFGLENQLPMPASGTDHHRCSGGFFFRRKKNGD